MASAKTNVPPAILGSRPPHATVRYSGLFSPLFFVLLVPSSYFFLFFPHAQRRNGCIVDVRCILRQFYVRTVKLKSTALSQIRFPFLLGFWSQNGGRLDQALRGTTFTSGNRRRDRHVRSISTSTLHVFEIRNPHRTMASAGNKKSSENRQLR